MNSTRPTTQLDAVIIGAGIAGLYQLYRLREQGLKVKAVEAGSNVGGTWYWNRYPGARVDSPSRTYTHTFGAGYLQDSEHCPQEENERYFHWVADTFDVRRFIEFDTEVKSLTWLDDAKKWEIVAEGPE